MAASVRTGTNEDDPVGEPAKYRRKLMLRSERAMGLEAVRVKPGERSGSPADFPPPAKMAEAPAPPAPAPRPNLFGAAETAPTARRPAAVSAAASTPIAAPLLPTEQKRAALSAMDRNEVTGCKRCGLCQSRTKTVFGEGNPDAQLMFIGEGPGENEDLSGRPFVGRAGELLDKQIAAMGLQRAEVFIANIVKCRPPGNRAPAPEETAACTPYLQRQVEIIRPKVIVTLGLPATQYILQSTISMGRMRGMWHSYRGIKVMPTYHPAYLLRNYTQEARRAVWSDLQQVMQELGLPVKNVAS